MAAVERSTSGDSSTAPARPPPLTQSDAITSLLSLSLAAADAAVVSTTATPDESPALDADAVGATADAPTTNGLSSSKNATTPAVPTIAVPMTAAAAAATANGKHHRRLGSTGKMRRRLSDAREASARPILAPTPTSSAALSLASLSLSTSPPSGHAHSQSLGHAGHLASHPHSHSHSQSQSQSLSYSGSGGIPVLAPSSAPHAGAVPIPIAGARSMGAAGEGSEAGEGVGGGGSVPLALSTSASGRAKKRGVDYRCESCAKIYRHPNCLNKHRWEHTRQWREASKFVLSKHQQVQLLEAAAILSYMGTPSTSLPDDRSEWPSFLSGGALPKVEPLSPNAPALASAASANEPPAASAAVPVPTSGFGQAHYGMQRTATYPLQPHPVSSSVPNVSSGPRLHDYSLPSAGVPVKVTQVRPGLLGVPTVSTAAAADAHATHVGHHADAPGGVAREGGWSLPNSALRSGSYAASARSSRSRSGSRSRSRSGSGSRSEESVDIDVDVDVEGMDEGIEVRVASSEGGGGAKAAYAAYPGYPAVSTTPGLSHSPGYGYIGYGHAAGYGYGHGYAGRRGVGMKREEDEMSVGFSVREEDEDEGDLDDVAPVKGAQDRKWDGMEMEVDMDMD